MDAPPGRPPDGGIDIDYNVSEHALLTHDGVPIWGLYPD
ncbi:MAG: aryl-sulfate sulfotransferase N-terminal domain-containing protein, partial [Lautropia mirabilis]